jgi:hypothetical protein
LNFEKKEKIMTQQKIISKEWLNYNLFTPIIKCSNTTATDYYRNGNNYQLFNKNGASTCRVQLMVPPAVRNYPAGSMYLHINHCSTSAKGLVNMTINGNSYKTDYLAPSSNFGVQTFEIPYSSMSLTEENVFEISLSGSSPGFYWLSDISFSFMNSQQTLNYSETIHVSSSTTGSVYRDITVTDHYRAGNPYLLFNSTSSECTIEFFTPPNFYQLSQGNLTIGLNHCATSSGGIVNMYLNGNIFESQYAVAPKSNFGVQNFTIPFSSLNTDGAANTFVIELYKGSGSRLAYYWLSDVLLKFNSKAPAVTETNYSNYVKEWILMQRTNIAELSKIPRDDMSAWQFIQNAPSWFFLPFMPLSPSELQVLIVNFPTTFLSVGFGMRPINSEARNFHRELRVSDLPRKNALRHAYWMALTTRTYGDVFADALGNAHEYAHLDLTIEGPYDHVTDKINNAVGIELAKNDKTTDIATLVDNAWANEQLAWAKNFRVVSGVQTADIFWQTSLNKLASTYSVIPDFNPTELATLAKHNITVPNKPPIYDEL